MEGKIGMYEKCRRRLWRMRRGGEEEEKEREGRERGRFEGKKDRDKRTWGRREKEEKN